MRKAFLRLLLLALLVVLVPARGWAVQIMSLQQTQAWTAVDAGNAADAAAFMALETADADAMPEDCPMHKAATGDAPPLCSGCDDCRLCLTVAAPQPLPSKGLGLRPEAVTPAEPLRFSSADGLGWLKPPIS